ncbi:hypothetical protein CsSME_00051720 [Camellia sinensis var. sinensis]
MVYLPMSYLYGKRFVGPITPTVLALRKELYTVPYHKIDWNHAQSQCAKVGKGELQTSRAEASTRMLKLRLSHFGVFKLGLTSFQASNSTRAWLLGF